MTLDTKQWEHNNLLHFNYAVLSEFEKGVFVFSCLFQTFGNKRRPGKDSQIALVI